MRKKILLVFIAILIINCVGASAESEEPAKAYRSINFGDSKEVVKQKISEDSKIKVESGEYSESVFITIWEKDFSLGFDYYNNQLYKIEFYGEDIPAEYFDTLIKWQRDLLVKIITEKYGNPTEVKDCSMADMKDGYVMFSHTWDGEKLGLDKGIRIGIGKNEEEFCASLWIGYLIIINEMKEERRAKEAEVISNNSKDF